MPTTAIPTKEQVERIIKCALETLYAQDHDLLNQRGLEVSINAKLACYIQQHLPDLNVDVEYRREGEHEKTNSMGKPVRPDIIIHKRGPKGPNVCVIEAKGHWNTEDRDTDRRKLMDFKQTQHYRYAYAVEYGQDAPVTTSI